MLWPQFGLSLAQLSSTYRVKNGSRTKARDSSILTSSEKSYVVLQRDKVREMKRERRGE